MDKNEEKFSGVIPAVAYAGPNPPHQGGREVKLRRGCQGDGAGWAVDVWADAPGDDSGEVGEYESGYYFEDDYAGALKEYEACVKLVEAGLSTEMPGREIPSGILASLALFAHSLLPAFKAGGGDDDWHGFNDDWDVNLHEPEPGIVKADAYPVKDGQTDGGLWIGLWEIKAEGAPA